MAITSRCQPDRRTPTPQRQLLAQGLHKPAACTHPQSDDDALASLALYYSKTNYPGRSDAGSAVPVLSRLTPPGCPTFIPAFTPGA